MTTPISLNLPVTINVPDSVPPEQAGAWVLARVRAYLAHYASRAGLGLDPEADAVTVEAIAERAVAAGTRSPDEAFLHPLVVGDELAGIDSLEAAVGPLKAVLTSLVGEAIVAEFKRLDTETARIRAEQAYSAEGLLS